MADPIKATSSNADVAAVQGDNTGVNGKEVTGGVGVVGTAGHRSSGVGVLGQATLGSGVVGRILPSAATVISEGVFGECPGGAGVKGHSTTGDGTFGISDTGVGVHGKGGRLAGLFEGDVQVTGKLDGPTVSDLLQRVTDLETKLSASAGIAIVKQNTFGTHIAGGPSLVLSLSLSEPGHYVLFARVAISNDDGDAQQATAQIHLDLGEIIDTVDVTIPGKAGMSLSLQGTLRVDPNFPRVLNLVCKTFNGDANESSIIAVQVSGFIGAV